MSELEREKFEARAREFRRGLFSDHRRFIELFNSLRSPHTIEDREIALMAMFALSLARSESAPSDLHWAWENGRDAALEFLSDRLKISMDVVQQLQAGALKWPGESAPATPISHDVLAGAAVAGRHEKAATADPGQRSTVGPDDIQGEAGSPAPAGCPQCGSVNRDYCNPECSNISTRNEWHRLAAPAPTEVKCPWCSFPTTLTGNVSPEDMICRRCLTSAYSS